MSWQELQHDQKRGPRTGSHASVAAVLAAPRGSMSRLGRVILAAITLTSTFRLGAALVHPAGQANVARPRPYASVDGGGWGSAARRNSFPLGQPGVVATVAARTWTHPSPSSSTMRRQAFWDGRGDSDARQKGGIKGKGCRETSVSPVPEGFPPASTLLRPEEVDYSLGNFLDASSGKFQKNVPSLWQSLRFRLKPFGRISSRTRVVRIKLGDGSSLNLVPRPSFIGMSELDLYGCTMALRTAAHDPRIRGVLLELSSVELSTATVMEVRRAMDYFTQSGKPLWGFTESSLDMTTLNLMGGCTRRIAAPGAYVNIIGFSFGSEFYRGLFDKVGIEPQVRRIGDFKSFGDTYARDSMSDAQREVTESLLSAVSGFKVGLLARDAGPKTMSEVEGLYNSDDPITVQTLKDFGLLDDVYYEDQMLNLLNRQMDRRYAGNFFGVNTSTKAKKPKKKKRLIDVSKTIIPATTYLKRTRRNPVEGVPGRKGDKTIAVLNAEGAIVNSAAAGQGNLLVENFRQQVKVVLQDPSIEGVVVRISSPGGDALASDLMWREVRRLREAGKSVVASVCNVAASGGYYIAMGCETIVCDELSITGSIGVVQAKFAIGELIEKVGVKIERISKGKYAELFAPERGFTPEEDGYWSRNAMKSYNDFVGKAAMSRRMPLEEMQRRAQGRVWTGAQAKALGLVDELGGLDKAIEVCRDMMDIRSLAATKLKAARRKMKKEEGRQEKKTEESNAASQAVDARVTAQDVDAHVTSGVSDTVVASDDLAEKEEEDEVLADSKIPFGPLGKILPEEYSDLERQVVAEAKEELRKRKEEAEKTGKKRLTRVRNIVPGPSGLRSLLGSVLQVEDDWGEGLQRLGLVPAQASKPAPMNLMEGLSLFIRPEASRPLAVMDDTIARMLPGISGVPEELRQLGVGPFLYTFLARSPGLAEALVDALSKAGLPSLLE